MSRFSKAEAEKRGWRFVHYQPESVVDLGDGITRTTPAVYTAEKSHLSGMQHETAETVGKLLERIHAWESRHPEPGLSPEPMVAEDNLAGLEGAERFQREADADTAAVAELPERYTQDDEARERGEA